MAETIDNKFLKKAFASVDSPESLAHFNDAQLLEKIREIGVSLKSSMHNNERLLLVADRAALRKEIVRRLGAQT